MQWGDVPGFFKWELVRLTGEEQDWARVVGTRRHEDAKRFGQRDAHGLRVSDEQGRSLHIEGASGELAVAKALGIPWDATVNVGKAPDVGGYQVRTRSKQIYELIVRNDDRGDEPYILALGTSPAFFVAGWIMGSEAKRHPEWRKRHGGREAAWFVPNTALRPYPLGSFPTPRIP